MKYSIIPNETKIGIVKAVHDGDSIKVKFEDGEVSWVRLYGCDAPEVVSNHVSATQPGGVEAGKFLRDLVKGKQVQIETLFRDEFKRMICKVDFTTNWEIASGVDLSEIMIKQGFAWFLADPKMPVEKKVYLKSLQDQAKKNKFGLWGQSGRKVRPSTWRGRNHNPVGFVNDPELW